jgi:hypothetical protein
VGTDDTVVLPFDPTVKPMLLLLELAWAKPASPPNPDDDFDEHAAPASPHPTKPSAQTRAFTFASGPIAARIVARVWLAVAPELTRNGARNVKKQSSSPGRGQRVAAQLQVKKPAMVPETQPITVSPASVI